MKKLLFVLLVFTATACKSQDFIWWVQPESVVPTPCTEGYGLLYNWYALNDSRNIAASGWGVMTPTERNQLLSDLGGTSVAGGKMKETGTTYWNSPNTGATNESKLNFRGGGRRLDTGTFGSINAIGWLWAYVSTARTAFYCEATNDDVGSTTYDYEFGYSVRLVKDATTLSDGEEGTYEGNDGKIYRTICISGVEYLADNLQETKFRNGDIIPYHGVDNDSTFTNAEWAALTTAGVCAYGNDLSNVGCDFSFPEMVDVNYGYLYNWYVTQGTGSTSLTSSDDWVVPTVSQYTTLQTYLGGSSIAGGKLKETGLTYWNTPNTGATNETGFNARGTGLRNADTFVSIKNNFYAWCSSEQSGFGDFFSLIYDIEGSVLSYTIKFYGKAIRLLYTGTGTPTSYTGNDGKVYEVVLIGTQYWLAVNLCETQLRDNTAIPEVTDGTTWAGLTTGARCSYDNDESNAINP